MTLPLNSHGVGGGPRKAIFSPHLQHDRRALDRCVPKGGFGILSLQGASRGPWKAVLFPSRSRGRRISEGKVGDATVRRFESYEINKHQFEEGNPEFI